MARLDPFRALWLTGSPIVAGTAVRRDRRGQLHPALRRSCDAELEAEAGIDVLYIMIALSLGVSLLVLKVPAMLKLAHWGHVFDSLAGDRYYSIANIVWSFYAADSAVYMDRPP
jgi:hypothetical protein